MTTEHLLIFSLPLIVGGIWSIAINVAGIRRKIEALSSDERPKG